MEQPICANSVLGRSPPSPGAVPPDLTEAKKGVGNRRRTTSNTRHRYTVHCFTNSKIILMLKDEVIMLSVVSVSPDETRVMKTTNAHKSFFISLAALLVN